MKNLIIKLKKYGVIFSLFFGNLLYGFIGFVLLISTAMLVSYFILEYFLLEENVVYAMKKSKLFLENDLFHFNKGVSNQFVNKRLFNVSKFSNTYATSLVHYSNLSFLNTNSSWVSNSKQLLEYKAQFSTYKNFSYGAESINFLKNCDLRITLDYLKSYTYYFNFSVVDENLFKFLPTNISKHICQSLGFGLEGHGWLVVKDPLSNSFFVGICSHEKVISSCDLGCGNAASMYKIISGVDFSGQPRDQYMRNFIIFEDNSFNLNILNFIKEMSIKNINNPLLDYNEILKLINSSEVIQVNKAGKFYLNSPKGVVALKCCLPLDTLFSISK